jgi:hypothetical protein
MAIVVAPATLYQPGTTVSDDVYGDSDGTITNTALAQTFIFDARAINVVGDANDMLGTSRGGNDTITVRGVSSSFETTLFGDAIGLGASSQGGNDQITGTGNVLAYGDGFFLEGDAQEAATT